MQNQRELVTKMKFSLHSKHMSLIMNLLQEHMLFMHKINSLESKQKKLLSRFYFVRRLKVIRNETKCSEITFYLIIN